MLKFLKHILFLFFLIIATNSSGQLPKAKWTNKDKGTFVISYSYMPVIPEDKSKNCGISIKMYELTKEGRKAIEGWAK